MIVVATKRTLNEVIKTGVFTTSVKFSIYDKVVLHIEGENSLYCFDVLHRCVMSYEGFRYVLTPSFCFVHKYFSQN